MSVSPELLWPYLRDNSCFVLKRKTPGRSGMGKSGARMTLEPNNLTGINSFKYSGLASTNTVSMTPTAGGIVLKTRSKKASENKPKTTHNKVTLTKDFRRVAKTIQKETSEKYYRADLQNAALAKWSLIYKSLKREAKA